MSENIGSFPTMITPYLKDGSVDYEMVERYVQWYYDNGCNGIFAVCQSSEIFYLSPDERVKINKTVYNYAQKIASNGGKKMTIVSSGHVSDSLEKQAYELNKIAESGTDALILITNRLDINNEGDDVLLKNLETLMKQLPEDIKLGLYECPYTYKRLVNPRILKWCVDTGRFYFMKDTCCDMNLINERMEVIRGSEFKLMNANCQTLLASLQAGAGGYCGIMANYHPRLYAWLCENYEKEPEKAKLVQDFLCIAGFTENGLPYPLTAKYHMCLENLQTEVTARNRKTDEFTNYTALCVEQLKELSDYITKEVIGVE